METFEIHITGDSSIVETGRDLNLKIIEINLLKPDRSFLRKEFMTSLVMKFPDFSVASLWTFALADVIRNAGTKVVRTKIESPDYPHYRDQSLYMESHFEASNDDYPMSRNEKKQKVLATARTYNRLSYPQFREKYAGAELELCLYDDFVAEDSDWMSLYGPENRTGMT